MALPKTIGDKSGLNRNFGNAQPLDESSNSKGAGISKRIGPIEGRVTRSKAPTINGTKLFGNKNGLSNEFGSATPVADTRAKQKIWG